MAAASGVIGALILTQVMHRAQAGLVSITVKPLAPTLIGSLWIGAVGGVIVVFTMPLLDKFKFDHVVSAIPLHRFTGIWGTIAVVLCNCAASLVTRSL